MSDGASGVAVAVALAPEPRNELTESVVTRLKRAMGPAAGQRCADEVLAKLGLSQLRSADDLLDFAICLLKMGGLAEVVGRALKITALLRGARDREPTL